MEVATEAIMEHTKTVNGKQVPIWTREEVDEIVTSQVKLHAIQTELVIEFHE